MDNQLRLHVGKRYKSRDGRRARITFQEGGKYYGIMKHNTSGAYEVYWWYQDGSDNAKLPVGCHLVSEWEDTAPEASTTIIDTGVNITIDDVGKKVKTRDGSVHLVIGYDTAYPHRPVDVGAYLVMANGKYMEFEEAHPKDVIEILD